MTVIAADDQSGTAHQLARHILPLPVAVGIGISVAPGQVLVGATYAGGGGGGATYAGGGETGATDAETTEMFISRMTCH